MDCIYATPAKEDKPARFDVALVREDKEFEGIRGMCYNLFYISSITDKNIS